MVIHRHQRSRWASRAVFLLVSLALSACVPSSTPPRIVALRILSAAVAASPSGYRGSCGASQTFRYTATLTANQNHAGGRAHYVWRIGQSTAEGDVSFGDGETIQELSQSVTIAVQPDAAPLLVSSIATTTPNAVSSEDLTVGLPCAAPLQILSADLIMSPSSADCGPHTFGFAAIVTASEGNPGGTVGYTWHFLDGSSREGSVGFASGQITATILDATTYDILSGRQPAALAPQSSLAPPGLPSPPPLSTPRPTPTRGPRPTPIPTRTPKPTLTPTTGPNGKPAHAGEIGAWLTVDAPNTLQTDTVAPTIDC